jgi:malonyl-CoA O-methyltransferase
MSSVRSAFNKASDQYDAHALLQKEIAIRLDTKLDVIAGSSKVIVDLGAGTGLLSHQLFKRFPDSQLVCLDFAHQSLAHNLANNKICADANHLPLADNSVDMVISSLMMQWCPDLKQLFSEIHRVLKELKKSWSAVDNETHVNTFTDMHDIGDQMLGCGFQSPVMEMEKLTLTYQKVTDLLRDLKAIGAQTVSTRSKSLMGKDKFQLMIKMYESYRIDGKLPATYEVIYGHAWKRVNKLGGIAISNQ